jgi:hypothetical protein
MLDVYHMLGRRRKSALLSPQYARRNNCIPHPYAMCKCEIAMFHLPLHIYRSPVSSHPRDAHQHRRRNAI